MEFPCPGCGAELKWKPGQGNLTCPYCGAEAKQEDDAPASAGVIEEYPLEKARELAPKGYGTATKSQTCGACAAVFDVPGNVTATECPFCTSTQVVEHSDESVIRPESVLPFAVEKNEAVRQFRQWLGGLWFRPSALKKAAQLERIHGVYLPAWTFDARARSRWNADAGYYYNEEETYTAQEDGKRVTKTRQVRKTRWEPARGSHEGSYDDWIVQASGGLDQKAIKGLLPFDLAKLHPYDTRYLSGFEAERYKIDLDDAWKVAQKELHDAETSACRSLVPGDTQRNLKVNTSFDGVRFKHTLLPVWIAAYRYENQVYRYLVNGESGKASGDAPISKWKVFFFVLSIAVTIGGCMGLLSLIGAIGAAVGAR